MRPDTRRLRQQRVFWAAAAAASLIIALCTANSLRWLDQPFPGFFVWENLFVAAVADTDWTGYEAGIPFQTRVVSIDGEPLRSARDLYARAARLPTVRRRATCLRRSVGIRSPSPSRRCA